MLFSEIYGSYFQVVAAVLEEGARGGLTEKRMTELVREKAFAESGLAIPAALKQGTWPLVKADMTPVVRHSPTMPLTHLQKRWLKALLGDRRIGLFSPDTAGLEDVKPLYTPDTFVFFDRYGDGDPYENEGYRTNFRTLLRAIHEKKPVRIRFRGHTGMRHSFVCRPYCLEYSPKDDKFRVLAMGKREGHTVNLGRIRSCSILEEQEGVWPEGSLGHARELTLLLHEERNALERVLLHLSHFEKETRRLGDGLYEIKLRYDRDDETELLIRVLSFGPVLEVASPPEFVALIRERLDRQGDLHAADEAQVCEK